MDVGAGCDGTQARRSQALGGGVPGRGRNSHRLENLGVDVTLEFLERSGLVGDDHDVRLGLENGTAGLGSELVLVLCQDEVRPQVTQPEEADRQNLVSIPLSFRSRCFGPCFRPDEDQRIAAAGHDQSIEIERIEARCVSLASRRIGRQRDRDLAAHLERLVDPGVQLLGPGHQVQDFVDACRIAVEMKSFDVGQREPAASSAQGRAR